jgi:hypothetical protein
MYTVFIPFLSKSKSIQRCLNALEENSVHKHETICTIDENDVYYAFNEGVFKAKYDTVVLINDDMMVSPGWDRLIPQYAAPDTILTMYVYEKYGKDLLMGPSPLQADFGDENHYDKTGFEQFATERSKEVADFTPNAAGWYMPMIVNKKTFVTFPNVVKFPLCANDFIMFHMVRESGLDYKFGVINSHVYHFAHASSRLT